MFYTCMVLQFFFVFKFFVTKVANKNQLLIGRICITITQKLLFWGRNLLFFMMRRSLWGWEHCLLSRNTINCLLSWRLVNLTNGSTSSFSVASFAACSAEFIVWSSVFEQSAETCSVCALEGLFAARDWARRADRLRRDGDGWTRGGGEDWGR